MTRCRILFSLLILSRISTAHAEPAITIYNQHFAVVHETIALDLKKGANSIRSTDVTFHVEPDSVTLKDSSGKHPFRVIEQNYRGEPISQELLLSQNEGKTISFLVQKGDKQETVQGQIIRASYVPHQSALGRFGSQYYQAQSVRAFGSHLGGGPNQPIIKVGESIQFNLPGLPIFPALQESVDLKPTIEWIIESEQAQKLDAALGYVTGGMTWEADYNLVSPEAGDQLELSGWVTLENQSGKSFENAQIKLMAGDVSKLRERMAGIGGAYNQVRDFSGASDAGVQIVPKTFDEYQLYTLPRRTSVRDRESKQVEFVRAAGIKSDRVYVYDGAQIDETRLRNYGRSVIQDESFGMTSNPKVWVMREFKNSEKNNLGIPLPAGGLRFYRQDSDGQLEFIGENKIDHTPKDETIRSYVGNAFDVVGERTRTQFRIDSSKREMEESFDIVLRNHKKEPVEVQILEHMYRSDSWKIMPGANTYLKKDSHTVEFRVKVTPDAESKTSYVVRYTW